MKRNLRRSLKYVFWGGVSISAADTLLVGPTLLGYAALFGAGDISFGILGAIPYFGNLAHMFSAYLLERNFSVRKTAFYTAFISRFFLFVAILLAFKPMMPGALAILILSLSLYYLIGCISGGVWLPWMKDLIPQRIMGSFFSFRFKYMMVAKIICFWFAALVFKYSKLLVSKENEIFVYVILLLIAFLIGLFSAWTLSQVEDKKRISTNSLSFCGKIGECLRNKAFRKLVFSLSFINFTVAFITPFMTVFMLKNLDIPMSTILIFTFIMQLSYTFVIKRLGKMANNSDILKVLTFSIPFLFCSSFLFLILNQITKNVYVENAFLTIGHIVFGIATAGVTLGINNASLTYVPKKMSAIYLSLNSVLKSFAGCIGSIFAGLILSWATLVEKNIFTGYENYCNRWTLFWLFSILICGMSYLTSIRLRKYYITKKSKVGNV